MQPEPRSNPPPPRHDARPQIADQPGNPAARLAQHDPWITVEQAKQQRGALVALWFARMIRALRGARQASLTPASRGFAQRFNTRQKGI